ncbi:MAG TPA: M23 family metallopeptidase, partial [Roseiflexaceae bacterium]|nr:M23 family metallopeptidase [Roseiflexaceae bacterium]
HVSAAGQGWSVPRGWPLVPGNGMIVITQEYGVGTHAPAAIWGGIDLAVDSDGDGFAEPAATSGVPVLATHDGVALVRPGTWPAGNYVRIINEEAGWSSAYAHLGAIDVRDGQRVRAGDLIGIIGSTGQASGPHLHYEIWRDGENIDPLPFVACTMASPSHHRLLAPAR